MPTFTEIERIHDNCDTMTKMKALNQWEARFGTAIPLASLRSVVVLGTFIVNSVLSSKTLCWKLRCVVDDHAEYLVQVHLSRTVKQGLREPQGQEGLAQVQRCPSRCASHQI